jgi:hypothetical protein
MISHPVDFDVVEKMSKPSGRFLKKLWHSQKNLTLNYYIGIICNFVNTFVGKILFDQKR